MNFREILVYVAYLHANNSKEIKDYSTTAPSDVLHYCSIIQRRVDSPTDHRF